MVPLSAETNTAQLSLRLALREATRQIHERLHRHDGFAAIQEATIGLVAYRSLLARLHGFHVPFEIASATGRERSQWLETDLRALGGGRLSLDASRMCLDVPRLQTAERRLGALYVVEGAALGGRELGRSLDGLLGVGVAAGRRFFIGRGAGTGQAWKAYLSQLSAVPDEPGARAEIIGAAVETFAAFENWLNGWSA